MHVVVKWNVLTLCWQWKWNSVLFTYISENIHMEIKKTFSQISAQLQIFFTILEHKDKLSKHFNFQSSRFVVKINTNYEWISQKSWWPFKLSLHASKFIVKLFRKLKTVQKHEEEKKNQENWKRKVWRINRLIFTLRLAW